LTPFYLNPISCLSAVDNQVYVMTASPARDLDADYTAWGHSMVVNPWGEVIAEHDETAGLIFADLGELL
jgi:predicted amidohydrolase